MQKPVLVRMGEVVKNLEIGGRVLRLTTHLATKKALHPPRSGMLRPSASEGGPRSAKRSEHCSTQCYHPCTQCTDYCPGSRVATQLSVRMHAMLQLAVLVVAGVRVAPRDICTPAAISNDAKRVDTSWLLAVNFMNGACGVIWLASEASAKNFGPVLYVYTVVRALRCYAS